MMLKQELIHSHILVAIFCGWEPQKPNKEFPNGYLLMRANEGDEQDTKVSNDDILEELPYEKDWNYLMAAYDVFRTQAEEIDEDDVFKPVMNIRDSLIDSILDYNIEGAFKKLIEGVNQINQLKLQES